MKSEGGVFGKTIKSVRDTEQQMSYTAIVKGVVCWSGGGESYFDVRTRNNG